MNLKKKCCKYIVEFCSAIKKNENMTFVEKWMEPEIIILSKINQSRSLKDAEIVIDNIDQGS